MKNRGRFIIKLLAFGILLAVALYAFPGSVEIDQQVFAVNIGFDRLDNGMLRITLQIPSGEQSGGSDSSGSSGGDSGSSQGSGGSGDGTQTSDRQKQLEQAKKKQSESQQSGYLIATADGINYADALNMMGATLPRLVNLSQVKQVIFSEAVAGEDRFADMLSGMMYDSSFYNAAQVVVCEGSAEEFLREQQLILGARLSKAQDAAQYAHLMMSFVPVTHVSDMYYGLHSAYYDAAATLCATNTFSSEASSNPSASGTVYAGQVARSGANLNEYMGCALFNDDHMVGRLTGYETQLLHILQGNLEDMLILESGNSAQITQRSGPDVKIESYGLAPKISIALDLYIVTQPLGPSAQAVEKQLEEDLIALIVKCQAMRVDPFGFGSVAVTHFATFESWNDYNWRDRFTSADVGLDVNIITLDA